MRAGLGTIAQLPPRIAPGKKAATAQAKYEEQGDPILF
jgi:hypothetical protein